MPNWEMVWEWVVSGVVQNAVWVVIGVLFAQFVQRVYEKIKYGGWRVIIRQKGRDVVDREISAGKVKEILSEPAEMSVFIKGVTSPYAWINCDVLTEGKKLGLFVEQTESRRLVIDLDKNPEVENGPKPAQSRTKRRS